MKIPNPFLVLARLIGRGPVRRTIRRPNFRRPRLEFLEGRDLPTGFFSPLTNLAPGTGVGTMELLPNGEVFAQEGGPNSSSNDVSAAWYLLSADAAGNVAGGTWSTAASMMSTPRLYYGSNVLPNGQFFVLGGEYSGTVNVSVPNHTGEVRPWSWTSNLYHTGLAQELRQCLELVEHSRLNSKPRSSLIC